MKYFLIIFISSLVSIYIWINLKSTKSKTTKTNPPKRTISAKIDIFEDTKKNSRANKVEHKEVTSNNSNKAYSRLENSTSIILENFNDLEAPTTPEGKLALKNVQIFFKQAPYTAFNYLKDLIDSGRLNTEKKKQFFIQLASRINVDDSKKVDLLEQMLRKEFYKIDFATDQEIYTAEITFESIKRSIKDSKEISRLERLKDEISNPRLRNLLNRI